MTDEDENYPLADEVCISALGQALYDVIETTGNPETKEKAKLLYELLDEVEERVILFLDTHIVVTGEYHDCHQITEHKEEKGWKR